MKPLNRHYLIKKEDKKKEQSAVLLPDDYRKEEDPLVVVEILDASDNCTNNIPVGSKVVVEKTMIREVKALGKTYHLIQENYLLGVVQ